jgi:hypothetical protein
VLLKSFRQCDCGLDVFFWNDFSPPASKNDDDPRSLRVVEAVTRAEVNLQLQNPISEYPMLTRIPVKEPLDANLNSSTAGTLFERINPIETDIGCFKVYAQVVSHKLQKNSRKPNCFPVTLPTPQNLRVEGNSQSTLQACPLDHPFVAC